MSELESQAGKSANESTSVELIYDGQVAETIDVSTPEGLGKLKQMAEKGLLYNKKMHSMAQVEKDAEKLHEIQGFITQAAQGNAAAKSALLNTFEAYGLHLTDKQSSELEGDDDLTDKTVKDLMNKVSSLEQKLTERQTIDLANTMDMAHKELAKEFDGKNGYPKYDPDAVEQYIEENKFYSPNVRQNYLAAYKLLNQDKILEAERSKATDIKRERAEKRNGAFAEKGGPSINLSDKKFDPKGKSWSEVAQYAGSILDEGDLFED
jgi:hypothetical protein